MNKIERFCFDKMYALIMRLLLSDSYEDIIKNIDELGLDLNECRSIYSKHPPLSSASTRPDDASLCPKCGSEGPLHARSCALWGDKSGG